MTLPPPGVVTVNDSSRILPVGSALPRSTTAELGERVHTTTKTDDDDDNEDRDRDFRRGGVLTRRPKSIQLLDISSLEATYLAYYNTILSFPFIEERGGHSPNIINSPSHPQFFPDFLPPRHWISPFSSPVIKYATLLYAASFKTLASQQSSRDIDHMHITREYFLPRYYKAVKEALSQRAYLDLCHGSYAMCQYAFITPEVGFDQIAQYVKYFLASLRKVTESPNGARIDRGEYFRIKCMCKDVFCWLTGMMGTDPCAGGGTNLTTTTTADSEDASLSKAQKLYSLAELSIPLFQSEFITDPAIPSYHQEDQDGIPKWMQTAHTSINTQLLAYRLQIYIFFLQTHLRSQTPFPFPHWLHRFSSTIHEISLTLSLNPVLRARVDPSQLFKLPEPEGSTLAPPHGRHDSAEWQVWQPAVMAHYKLCCRSANGLGGGETQVAEEGIRGCRGITPRWRADGQGGVLRMNSLSALRSLFLVCLSIAEMYSAEGTHPIPRSVRGKMTPFVSPAQGLMVAVYSDKIRGEITKVFDLQRYLQIRSKEWLLRHYDPRSCLTAPLREVLRVDAGGFLDCMGQLRDDGVRNCASCGRHSCEYVDMETFL